MSKCSTNKRVYASESIATDALIEARIRFEHNTSKAVYLCDDCGGWHLTSQGEMHPRLKAALDSGSIKKEKEAFHWQKKFRF